MHSGPSTTFSKRACRAPPSLSSLRLQVHHSRMRRNHRSVRCSYGAPPFTVGDRSSAGGALTTASKVACVICCCAHVIVFCRCLPTALSDRTASSHSHPGTDCGRPQTHAQAQQPHNRRHRQVLSWLESGPRVWYLSGCTADDSNPAQSGYSGRGARERCQSQYSS